MAEKTRSISGCDSESEIGHDVINIMYPTIIFDNNSSSTSVMNVSQISNTSTDSTTNVAGGGGGGGMAQSKTNLNITHNIGGVSKDYFYLLFLYFIFCNY